MSISDFLKSGNERLDRQLLFSAEIDRMTAIMRRTLLIDKSRRENDAEHSWHIAVMAMLLKEYAREEVDLGRVVQMCVVHDLVEIEADDTFAYDDKGNIDKAEREARAADILFSRLPEDQGKMIRDLWEEFDAMETPDARYAACMDRLQPFMHNTLTDGNTWKQGKVRRSQVEKRLAIVRQFMPEVYQWVENNIEAAVEKGWISMM